jgi:hypothetical protein
MNIVPDQVEKRDFKWLFDGPSGQDRQGVRQWWQQRRLRYNRDLLLVGIMSWVLVLVVGSATVRPGEDFEEPLLMIFGPLLYAGFANAAYTAGPVFDMVLFRGSPRRTLFKAGYIFSLMVTAIPGVWVTTAWLTTLVTGQKL